MEKYKYKSQIESKLKKSKTPTKKINTHQIKYKKLSEYIKLNKQSFNYLENKNYPLAKFHFSKNVEISQEIDQSKYIESLINYSLSLYYNKEFLPSYNALKKAKDLSYALYKDSQTINQIYFIYLRAISNMCLISMNLNKITESKKLFKQIISLIKEPKIQDISIQLTMLKELIYIFYRVYSLDKFQEINDNNINISNMSNGGINSENKGLYYLYKSLKNNDLNYWLNFLNEEIKQNNISDINGYAWLLINRLIVLYYQKDQRNNETAIKKAYKDLITFLEDNLESDIDINNDINQIYFNFKTKFDIAVEYYYEIANLEKELSNELNKSLIIKDINCYGKENKIIVILLIKNAIKNLNESHKVNKDIIISHFKQTLALIENNKINWELLSILNINKDLIRSIKTVLNNLILLKTKIILKQYFHKFKLQTLGYISPKGKLKKQYTKIEPYLKAQLKSLEEGSILLKINYSSNGYKEHFFRICYIDKEFYLSVHKTISDIKPHKIFKLKDLYSITIGYQTENLIKKINEKFMKAFKPCNIMSLWFKERIYDLYFDNDDEMNRWFEAIYYHKRYIEGKYFGKNLGYLFINKSKLRMLHKLKNCENHLPIIKQLKYYSELNLLEYYSLPFSKSLIMYYKVYEKIEEKEDEKKED